MDIKSSGVPINGFGGIDSVKQFGLVRSDKMVRTNSPAVCKSFYDRSQR